MIRFLNNVMDIQLTKRGDLTACSRQAPAVRYAIPSGHAEAACDGGRGNEEALNELLQDELV
jgi:hypothetical protein